MPAKWLLVLLQLALFPQTASAQREPLTTTDYLLWGSSSALLVVDWGQTHDLVVRGHDEANVFLGTHPTHGEVNRYFVVMLAGHALVSRLHKKEHRRIVWAFLSGMQLEGVWTNHRLGLTWSFRF